MILPSASPITAILSVVVALAYTVPAAAAGRMSARSARAWLLLGWLLHALVLGCGLLGDTPRFGFAPALSMTAWLVLTIYGVESHLFPQLPVRWALAAVGGIAVLLPLAFPGAHLEDRSPWLPLHLALGIASYGLFATAVLHAWFMTRAEKQIRQASNEHAGVPLMTLERLTFRFVTVGFVLLTATLLAGWLFAETLYGPTGTGPGWQWDHKTVFSILSWLTFATLLLGRARFGWRGRKAVRFLYAGSGLLLLAYVGSRFVLEVILGRTP
jgi:ABC-type uncharacterized transport system permease subunit